MKTKMLIKIILTAVLVPVFITACLDKEIGDKERVSTLNIGPKIEYIGTSPPLPPLSSCVPCMVVSEEGAKTSSEVRYLTLQQIEGFEYEEGYEYRVRVTITTLSTPPADGPIETYKLIDILSKDKILE